MVPNYYILIVVTIAAVLVLCSLYVNLCYQNMKSRDNIIARAKEMGCSDIRRLRNALDYMSGSALRTFSASSDAEFRKRLTKILVG